MRRYLFVFTLMVFATFVNGQIVQWTFETSLPTTAGPHAAEVGTGSANGFHAGTTTYSNPVGNGSLVSFSSNNWAVGDYYQFQFSTTGYNNINISVDANSSSTGPRDFTVQYSTDGSSFTDITSYAIPNGITWSGGSSNISSIFAFDLSAIAAIQDASTVYIRLRNYTTTATNGGTVASGGTSRVDNITVNGTLISSSTDHFRSITTGNWNSTSTWEQSQDNITWSPATTVPNSIANTITIRNTHTVTLSASTSADQVVIQNGGILIHNGGTFMISDGAGDDIDIQNGGIFTLGSSAPLFSLTTATVNVATGGTLRIAAPGLTGAGTGVNANNYVYQHQSILEYTLSGGFSSSGVIFFPNVSAVTIPIFRVTVSSPTIMLVGAGSNTTFNGLFELSGTGTVRWQNSGNKIFRNGIRNTGTIDYEVLSIGTGKFIINGSTAELGGTGSISLPPSTLEIGSASGTTVNVTSSKTLTGDVSLLSTNTFVELGSNTLTITGNITGGGSNAYVRTNGSGLLTLNSIDAAGKVFPIGNTSYNPLTISNGSNVNYSARVLTGIIPAPAFPTFGINRTWEINASVPTPSVTVAFQYAGGDANAGVLPQPQDMEILMYSGSAWSIIAGNGAITPTGSDPYTVTTTTALTINNSPVPYALGKSGGYILPIDFFITARSEKRDNDGIIGWDVFETANVRSFEVQRSMNNGEYKTIVTVSPTVNQLAYSYTDINIPAGTNLYRIKVNRISGAVRYSNTVAIINDTKGLLITSVFPNPVSNTATITLSAARSGMADVQLYDISGTVVYRRRSAIAEGTNNLPIELGKLSAGVYHLAVQSADSKAVYRLVKQ